VAGVGRRFVGRGCNWGLLACRSSHAGSPGRRRPLQCARAYR